MCSVGVRVQPVVAEQAVHDAVAPRARTEVQPSLDSLAAKAGLFERALLSEVHLHATFSAVIIEIRSGRTLP